ncbi:hypothetical protein C1H46_011837 [Malus baccata]|uniref:Uncharacterized protein n=1 Tax=Malus baccata TaxID=106549 RepID=A0A540MUT1_MALBA|nr:hypothetical protein C1H46_011837 [Malus baccata]
MTRIKLHNLLLFFNGIYPSKHVRQEGVHHHVFVFLVKCQLKELVLRTFPEALLPSLLGFHDIKVPLELNSIESVGEFFVFLDGKSDGLLAMRFSDLEALSAETGANGLKVDLSGIIDLVACRSVELVNDESEVKRE